MEYRLKIVSLVWSSLFLTHLNATQLGQMTVQDPVMGLRTITYEQKHGYAIAEGDILLGKVDYLNHQGAVITLKLGGTRWPNGIVSYEINKDLPFRNKLAILQAIDHWQKHSRIQFIEVAARKRSDYRDFISFIPAEGTTCASFVGRQGGKQVIELAPRCTTMNTVHEIGHALGMWHEQSRADRDNHVRILWENIEEGHQYNFNQHLTDGNDYGEYDYQSIMHYGPYSFSKNGQKTIVPLIEGVEIGQRNQLSPKDIAAINDMYPEE